MFKITHLFHKELMLFFTAETENLFHTGTVVPATVEKYDLLTARKMGNIALKIPRSSIFVRRFTQRNDTHFTRTQMLRKPFDDTVFTGSIPSFENQQHLLFVGDNVTLKFDQLNLQIIKRFFIRFLIHRRPFFKPY